MRLTQKQLYEITGLKRRSAQVAWFKNKFGVAPPFDRRGPVISAKAFEMLLERKLGLVQSQPDENKPTVRLREREK